MRSTRGRCAGSGLRFGVCLGSVRSERGGALASAICASSSSIRTFSSASSKSASWSLRDPIGLRPEALVPQQFQAFQQEFDLAVALLDGSSSHGHAA
jgi:hypothetical protein